MQPVVKTGMGEHFSSPPKKRNTKRKTQTLAFSSFNPDAKRRKLQAEMDSCREGSSPVSNPFLSTNQPEIQPQEQIKPVSMDWLGGDQSVDNREYLFPEFELRDTAGSTPTAEDKKRRTAPNQTTYNLHSKWTHLIPSLIDDFLEYSKLAIGKTESIAPSDLKSRCLHPLSCQYRSRKIICLFFDREYPIAQQNYYISHLFLY